MKRIFPEMYDRPDKGMAVAVILYGFIAFILIPVVVVILGLQVWTDQVALGGVELVYHVFNGFIAAAMFKSYLGESFYNVQLFPKKFWKTVAIGSLIMLTIALELQFAQGFLTPNAYPINELPITMVSGLVIQNLPIWGTLCHVIFAPFAVACLYYATGFAPFTCKKPWLGYLIVPIALIIPLALDINWRGGADYKLYVYFLQLPIHLIACWSYHKADTIWAPITCLAIFNLVTSLLCLLPV